MSDFDSPSAQERQHHADQRALRAEQTARWADEWREPDADVCPECPKGFTVDDRLVAVTLGGRRMHESCFYEYDRREQVYAAAYPLPNGRDGR